MSTTGLKEDIERLQELRLRLQRVREVPPVVMKKRDKVDEFGAVRQMGERVESDAMQRALARAAASAAADATDIWTESRRERRKRSRARSPEPSTLDPAPTEMAMPTPEPGIDMAGLADWARAYNGAHTTKIRIKGRLLRMAIPDVMTVYMGIGTGPGSTGVVVDTIRAFGPREPGGGLGQSMYGVFQQLSQQLMGLAEDTPRLAAVVGGVAEYATVFVDRCSVCGRVVGGEGHVPAVVRRGGVLCHAGCGIGGAVG